MNILPIKSNILNERKNKIIEYKYETKLNKLAMYRIDDELKKYTFINIKKLKTNQINNLQIICLANTSNLSTRPNQITKKKLNIYTHAPQHN